MKVRVLMFGPFRKFGEEAEFELNDGARVKDLRAAFRALNCDDDLLACSRFASETEVLSEDAVLSPDMTLAVIAPISGG